MTDEKFRAVSVVCIKKPAVLRRIAQVQEQHGHATSTETTHKLVMMAIRLMELCDLHEKDGGKGMSSKDFGLHCAILINGLRAERGGVVAREAQQTAMGVITGKKRRVNAPHERG